MNLETGLTPNEIKSMLSLERHPTCGFVAETYRSSLKIPASGLPEAYNGEGDPPTPRRFTSSSPRIPR